MKLVMHIGSPKVGSTAIQSALAARQDDLAAQDAWYLDEDRGLATKYQKLRTLPGGMARRFASVAEAEGWSESCWQRFETELAARRPRVTVLSSEQFLNIKQHKRLLARLRGLFDDIHAVAYLRDPLSQFASGVFQRIRDGARLEGLLTSWDLENQMWAAPALDRYADTLGAVRLTVRLTVRHAAPGNLAEDDVVADFFAMLQDRAGVALDPPEPDARPNASLSGAAAAHLLAFNEAGGVAEARWALLAALRADPVLQSLPRLAVTGTPLAPVLLALGAARCAHVNQSYLAGQVLLPVGAPVADLPDRDDMLRWVRDWITSYLTPRAQQALAQLSS